MKEKFPIDNVLAAETVGLRIGSPVGEPLVYLQFFFTDPATEEEKRYTIRISVDQMRMIADTYPKVKDEIDMFAVWDQEFDTPTE